VKYWIKNISRNIQAVFFKLGARNIHHKRNRMFRIPLIFIYCPINCICLAMSWLLISSLIFTKTPLKHLALFKTCLFVCFVCFITRVIFSSSLGSEIGPMPLFVNLQNSFGLGALPLFIFASKQLQLSVSSFFRQLSILRIT